MKRAIKPIETIETIETIEELHDAEKRIVALDGSLPGSPEEDELQALVAAVEKWKIDHADMPPAIKPRTD